MRTLLPDPPPAEFETLLEQRRRSGADRRDEVWKGVVHLNRASQAEHGRLAARVLIVLAASAPAAGLEPSTDFNLGESADYRIPDAGLLPPAATGTYLPTAPLLVEVVSPGDETWDKLPFYAAHGVDELLIIDPKTRTVEWFALDAGEYQPIRRSKLIDLGPDQLAERLDWPPTG